MGCLISIRQQLLTVLTIKYRQTEAGPDANNGCYAAA